MPVVSENNDSIPHEALVKHLKSPKAKCDIGLRSHIPRRLERGGAASICERKRLGLRRSIDNYGPIYDVSLWGQSEIPRHLASEVDRLSRTNMALRVKNLVDKWSPEKVCLGSGPNRPSENFRKTSSDDCRVDSDIRQGPALHDFIGFQGKSGLVCGKEGFWTMLTFPSLLESFEDYSRP